VSQKKLALFLLAAVVLILALGFMHSFSAASVPAAPSFLFGEIAIAERSSDEYYPAIAYNSIHNEYLVVWENLWPGGSEDIYAQRISSTGQLLSWFAVSSSSHNQQNPSVAYDPVHDRYLVVWAYDYNGDGSDWDIYGRFIPWSGPDPGLTDLYICDWPSTQGNPQITYALAQQEFLVVWANWEPSVPSYISARRVFADGSGFPDNAFMVSSGAETRAFPDVAYNLARNEYMVTWDMDLGGGNIDIYGLRLTGTGVFLGSEFAIAGWPDSEERPSVAACHQADQYLVAWQSDHGTGGSDFAIYARYLSGDAVPGNVYMVDDSTTWDTQVDVNCNAAGQRYLLAWQSGHGIPNAGIWARVAYPNEVWGSVFDVHPPISFLDCAMPTIGGGGSSYLVAWEYEPIAGGNVDIHGQLVSYGAFLPLVQR
jgi:hypothetical protein